MLRYFFLILFLSGALFAQTFTQDCDKLYNSGQPAKLARQLEKKGKTATERACLLYYKGLLNARSETALTFFKEAATLNGGEYSAQANLEIGKIYFINHDEQQAKIYLEKLSLPESLFWLGLCASREHAEQKAVTLFTKYLQKEPRGKLTANARLQLAEVYSMQKKPLLAIENLEKLLNEKQAAAYYAPALLRIAENNLALGNQERAFLILTQIMEDFPYSQYAFEADAALEKIKSSPPEQKKFEQPYKLQVTTVTDNAVSSQGGYVLQAGAFSTCRAAEKHARKIKDLGYKSYVFEKDSAGRILNAVGIGPFPTVAEAEKAKSALKNNNINCFMLDK